MILVILHLPRVAKQKGIYNTLPPLLCVSFQNIISNCLPFCSLNILNFLIQQIKKGTPRIYVIPSLSFIPINFCGFVPKTPLILSLVHLYGGGRLIIIKYKKWNSNYYSFKFILFFLFSLCKMHDLQQQWKLSAERK